MDDSVKSLLRRLIRRIPGQLMKVTLEKWGRLSAEQQQTIDFSQSKWMLTENLLALCEVWQIRYLLQTAVWFVNTKQPTLQKASWLPSASLNGLRQQLCALRHLVLCLRPLKVPLQDNTYFIQCAKSARMSSSQSKQIESACLFS